MTPLRRPPFRNLWVAGLVSDTGDWLLLVSLPILVFRDTGSTLGTAGAFLIELVPPVLLAPLAGAVADRLDRRRTLVVVSAAQALSLAPLLLVDGGSAVWLIYLVLALQSGLAAVFDPTKNALLPTLVEPGQLVAANSLTGLGHNVGRLLGGSLGGVMLTAGGGIVAIALVDGVTFLVALALLAAVAPTHGKAPERTDPRRAPHPGTRGHVLRIRPVRSALLVTFIASVAQGIFVVLYIVFVVRILHGGSGEVGMLRGVQAIGAIAAGVLVATARRVSVLWLTAGGAVAFGLLDLTIWNTPPLTTAPVLFALLFAAAGAPGTILTTGLESGLQRGTVEGQRGSAFAAAGVAEASGQAIGIVGAGVLGDTVGLMALLDAQGVLYLIAGAVAAYGLTNRRRGDRRVRRNASSGDSAALRSWTSWIWRDSAASGSPHRPRRAPVATTTGPGCRGARALPAAPRRSGRPR